MSATPFQSADHRDAALIVAAVSGVSHWMLMNQGRRSVARARWEMRRVADSRAAVPTQRGPTYQVEHRTDRCLADLGVLDDPFRHHAALAPFASFLGLSGRVGGEVVLIKATSARVVARRVVARSKQQVESSAVGHSHG